VTSSITLSERINLPILLRKKTAYLLLFLIVLPEIQLIIMRIILLVKITVHFRNGLLSTANICKLLYTISGIQYNGELPEMK